MKSLITIEFFFFFYWLGKRVKTIGKQCVRCVELWDEYLLISYKFSTRLILSSHAESTDFPDSFFPSISIIHHSQHFFFQTIFCVCTELKFLLVSQHRNIFIPFTEKSREKIYFKKNLRNNFKLSYFPQLTFIKASLKKKTKNNMIKIFQPCNLKYKINCC